MDRSQPSYTFVINNKSLHRLADKLKKEAEIAFDLEADSMFHYQEKVCLIQISTPSQNILIDPLSLNDLSPLGPIFSDPQIRKVFHGADYDIRSLYRDFKIDVNNLFDTQIAASFLGMKEIGLAALLKNILGIDIDKKYQKRDWSKRPLPPAMLSYAVHDSCHLLNLARIFERELRDKKRYLWVLEECKRLSKVRPLSPDNNPLFMKFKNARMLDPRGLTVVEFILKLRDELARRRDRPPFKILNNKPIMEIALAKPQSKTELERATSLSAGQIKNMGSSIIERVAEAMALPEDRLPAFPKKPRPKARPDVSPKVKELKSWRKKRAKELNIDPALLCTNAQIDALSRVLPESSNDLDNVEDLREWQKKLYGREIITLLKASPRSS